MTLATDITAVTFKAATDRTAADKANAAYLDAVANAQAELTAAAPRLFGSRRLASLLNMKARLTCSALDI